MPSLEPLAELEIVLILAPDQPVDIDVTADAILRKGRLEQLVVGHVLEAGLAAPVDARDRDALREDVLAQLAGHGAGAGLLDLGQVHVERVVEEGQELVLRNEVGGIHHPDGGIGRRPHGDAMAAVVYFWLALALLQGSIRFDSSAAEEAWIRLAKQEKEITNGQRQKRKNNVPGKIAQGKARLSTSTSINSQAPIMKQYHMQSPVAHCAIERSYWPSTCLAYTYY